MISEPSLFRLTRCVVPATRSRTKMSCTLFVSSDTNSDDVDAERDVATVGRHRAEPGPIVLTQNRVVRIRGRAAEGVTETISSSGSSTNSGGIVVVVFCRMVVVVVDFLVVGVVGGDVLGVVVGVVVGADESDPIAIVVTTPG